jgi:hypothetical protein
MAVRALTGISDLLASSARTLTEGPAPSLAGRRPADVTAFLTSVLLDTTAPGSYIMTARVPVGRPHQDGRGGEKRQRGRPVVERMHRAITAAHTAASRIVQGEGDLFAFDEAVWDGVTAQLCEALLELAGQDKSSPFDIRFSWARGLPSELPAQSVSFTSPMISVLNGGAKRLKELAAGGKATITGRIKEMHYDPAPHRVKAQGTLTRETGPGQETTIWVRLNAEQYARASQEHQDPHLLFQFTGHLTRVQRRVEMLIGREGYVTVPSP